MAETDGNRHPWSPAGFDAEGLEGTAVFTYATINGIIKPILSRPARILFATASTVAWPNAAYVTRECVMSIIDELGERLELNFRPAHDHNAKLRKLSVKYHPDKQRGADFRMKYAAAAIFDLISRYRAKLE